MNRVAPFLSLPSGVDAAQMIFGLDERKDGKPWEGNGTMEPPRSRTGTGTVPNIVGGKIVEMITDERKRTILHCLLLKVRNCVQVDSSSA